MNIPQYNQGNLPDLAVGTPGVDNSGASLLENNANALNQIATTEINLNTAQRNAEAQAANQHAIEMRAAAREAQKELAAQEKQLKIANAEIESEAGMTDFARASAEVIAGIQNDKDPHSWGVTAQQRLTELANVQANVLQGRGASPETILALKKKLANSVTAQVGSLAGNANVVAAKRNIDAVNTMVADAVTIGGNSDDFQGLQTSLHKLQALQPGIELAHGKDAGKVIQKAQHDMAEGYLYNLLDTKPDQVEPSLKSGAFDSLLDPKERVAIKSKLHSMANERVQSQILAVQLGDMSNVVGAEAQLQAEGAGKLVLPTREKIRLQKIVNASNIYHDKQEAKQREIHGQQTQDAILSVQLGDHAPAQAAQQKLHADLTGVAPLDVHDRVNQKRIIHASDVAQEQDIHHQRAEDAFQRGEAARAKKAAKLDPIQERDLIADIERRSSQYYGFDKKTDEIKVAQGVGAVELNSLSAVVRYATKVQAITPHESAQYQQEISEALAKLSGAAKSKAAPKNADPIESFIKPASDLVKSAFSIFSDHSKTVSPNKEVQKTVAVDLTRKYKAAVSGFTEKVGRPPSEDEKKILQRKIGGK